MNDILIESRKVLNNTPLQWVNFTKNVSVDLLGLNPAPSEWSAMECLQHLVDAEQWVFPVRLKALLDGQDFPAFDPDSEGSKSDRNLSPVELAEEFATRRAASLALFDRLTSSDLYRQARHQTLGTATLSELLHEWAGHDLMHTVQAERAVMQSFIQGSGPWRFLFQDHDANGETPAE